MEYETDEVLLRQQDREAIAEGIRQMEAGEGQPLDNAFAEIRSRLGFSPAHNNRNAGGEPTEMPPLAPS